MNEKITDFFEIIQEAVEHAQENGIPSVLPYGALHALRCYEESETDQTTVNDRRIIECRKLPPIKDSDEFLDFFKEAGVTELAITDNTNLISFLHGADGLCCYLNGLCTVERHISGEELPDDVQGILIKL